LDVAISLWLVATVWHPATNAKIAVALTIPVRVNSFFICFVLIVLLLLEKITVVLFWFVHPDNSKPSAARL
jgi:hypothetical protein